jgi:hypothetical protein
MGSTSNMIDRSLNLIVSSSRRPKHDDPYQYGRAPAFNSTAAGVCFGKVCSPAL